MWMVGTVVAVRLDGFGFSHERSMDTQPAGVQVEGFGTPERLYFLLNLPFNIKIS